ncbi:DUF5069 domain-containing protein [Candidatus Pacearchaeota archaeon]|nr:DUF5069 domain-containing protein [Candidatus Pacearchaeota archaeon]
MHMLIDLTHNPPRSAAIRLGGYAILARTLDKCRATIHGKQGEYHFDCPVDKELFTFKEITGDAFKAFVHPGKSDAEVIAWLGKFGQHRTPEEIKAWSDRMCTQHPGATPSDFGAWFTGECTKVSLDPVTTTLFHWLDVDDKMSFIR